MEKVRGEKNIKTRLNDKFLQSYQHILCDANNLFFLGRHAAIVSGFGLIKEYQNLDLGMEIRKKILSFSFDLPDNYQTPPVNYFLAIVGKYSQQKLSPSPTFEYIGTAAAQCFADYFPGRVGKKHIAGLLGTHLFEALGGKALVVDKSLEAFIYLEAIDFAKQKRYLTKPNIILLIKNAMAKNKALQNVMSQLSWGVGAQLRLLTLSIHQLATALAIVWVSRFNHIPTDWLDTSSSGELVPQLTQWISDQKSSLNLSKLSELVPLKKDLSQFRLIASAPLSPEEHKKIAQNKSIPIPPAAFKTILLTRKDLTKFFCPIVEKLKQNHSTIKFGMIL
jgi:hypothetical protein